MVGAVVLIVGTVLATLSAYEALQQHIRIVACEPPVPEGLQAQTDCKRQFAQPGDQLTVGPDTRVTVAGITCLDLDEPLPVTYEVAWQHAESGTRLIVLDGTQSTIDPGCRPYEFAFPLAPSMLDATGPIGVWKLVGKAIPDDPNLPVYRWDATAAVEMVVE